MTAIELRVGHLRQVVPDSLAFYFEHVARDTVCEGAALTWKEVPARLRCEECGYVWQLQAPAFRCPMCIGSAVVVDGGDELHVEWIEVEQEGRCTV